MRNGDDLHKLIHSLSKAEKRYFKIQVQQPFRKSPNNYLLLFNAIEKQTVYDESKLCKKLRQFVFSKKLAKTKYLLYELIVKIIRQMYAGRSIRSKINMLLESVELLYNKTLYHQSLIPLKKARKLASKYELYFELLTVINWENRLTLYCSENEEILLQRIEEYKVVVDLLRIENEHKKICENMQLWYDNFVNLTGNHHVKVDIKRIQQNPLMIQMKTETFLSRLYYYKTCSLLALSKNRYISALPYFQIMSALWEQWPHMVEIHKKEYIQHLTSFFIYSLNAKRKEVDYGMLLDNLRVLKSSTQQEAIKASFLFSLLDFMYCLTFGYEERCNRRFFELQESFKHHTSLDEHWKTQLYYHLAIYHYLAGRYNEALYWIDFIENIQQNRKSLGLKEICNLLQLVAFFDPTNKLPVQSKINIQNQCELLLKRKRTAIEDRVIQYTKTLLTTNFSNFKNIDSPSNWTLTSKYHHKSLLDDPKK